MEAGETNHIIDLSDRLYKIILAIIALAAVYVIGQMAYDFKALPQNYPQDIAVSGEGKAFAKPDVATVNLGVNTQGLKSQEVVNQNNKKMNEVIQSIKDLGIDEKDIQTTMYNLNPMYDYNAKGRVFKGYSLDQQVKVKIRDFDKISEVLDKTTEVGATTVGDLQFTVDDIEKVKVEARAKAIEQAKQKAVVLVNQAGLKIVKLVNVYESYGPYPQLIYGLGAGGALAKESITPPQIEPGQTEITANVTLTYRIK